MTQPIEGIRYSDATIEDLAGVLAAASRTSGGGAEDMRTDKLAWWYFANPSNSFSFSIAMVSDASQQKIEGYASTNNFFLETDWGTKLVGMPQKVLTTEAVRGKGVFGKLYRHTEAKNLSELHVDFFLTVTNAASTPIFLEKFSYVRGKFPALLVFPWNPFLLLLPYSARRVSGFDEQFFNQSIYISRNSVNKTRAHLKWRYESYKPDQYHLVEIKTSYGLAYVVLKPGKRKGIPLFFLMEILVSTPASLSVAFQQVQRYLSRQPHAVLLALGSRMVLDACAQSWPVLSLPNRFNFLVKGKLEQETVELSKVEFNLNFGDLDFI
jgi:hypothetical protein